jgi:hypothetical protein
MISAPATYLFIPVPNPEQLAKEAELAEMQLLGEAEYTEYVEMQDDFISFSEDSGSEESDDSVSFFLGNFNV